MEKFFHYTFCLFLQQYPERTRELCHLKFVPRDSPTNAEQKLISLLGELKFRKFTKFSRTTFPYLTHNHIAALVRDLLNFDFTELREYPQEEVVPETRYILLRNSEKTT